MPRARGCSGLHSQPLSSAMATHITPAAAQGQTRKYFASTTHQDTFEEAAGI